ncbi:unnamed protein product [Meganyctiphanes norvegica]|uniref:Putative nuclease HARBI1 n=1 Tax=Meganyctiphanes norvegica TaxID=48144 RepID=A0AAV2QHL0_MEGNR
MAFNAALYFERGLYRERVFEDPLDLLHISDENLLRDYRFPRREIIDLINELDPYLQRATNRSQPIPTCTQVLVALRYFASGTFQSEIGEEQGIQQSSVSKVLDDIIDILVRKAKCEINMPTENTEITRNMQEFAAFANFPRVIGVIGCSHIAIKKPLVDSYVYVNRQQFHSINVMIVCDADWRIISYSAKYPGDSDDSFIWDNSHIRRRFLNEEFGDGLLIGDSGFPLEPFMMVPFQNPATNEEEKFNLSHKKTQVWVEQCFGILKNRFRCLHMSGGELPYIPIKCARIIICCLFLHNLCIRRNIPIPEPDDLLQEVEVEVEMEEEEEEEVDEPIGSSAEHGNNVRNEIVQNVFA